MMSQICNCGYIVSGYTEKQLIHLLTIHKKSSNHKRQIKLSKSSHAGGKQNEG